ncbi:hypothetical protein [Tuwongella immobilis]|uniref:Uncharacterized protein n=1 Tax=Tuwongella immobilis TaxID=692036 RepID=A0A6C2YR95_9BACT|nr:hypothetical protein [Tuwongella immobilis]VIP04006.1 unnamed protein product [Tuwongella immobilis]VTS05379.1 unnamed protein product [Tuwongella immobilis]
MLHFRMMILAGICLSGGSGCLRHFNGVDAPTTEQLARMATPSHGHRNQVHIFLFNGLDPLEASNLRGLQEYLATAGYTNATYGQIFHGGHFTQKIATLRKENPNVRIALIGHDVGASTALGVAQQLAESGTAADLLVLLDAKQIASTIQSLPRLPAAKVVNIRSESWIIESIDVPNAENVVLPRTLHAAVPTHATTVQVLTERLNDLAWTVPHSETIVGPGLPLMETAPTPRPVVATSISRKDPKWGFLTPRTGGVSPFDVPTVAAPPAIPTMPTPMPPAIATEPGRMPMGIPTATPGLPGMTVPSITPPAITPIPNVPGNVPTITPPAIPTAAPTVIPTGNIAPPPVTPSTVTPPIITPPTDADLPPALLPSGIGIEPPRLR